LSVDIGYALLVGWRVLDVICLSLKGEMGAVLFIFVECWRWWKIPLVVVGLVAVVFLASTPQLARGRVGWW